MIRNESGPGFPGGRYETKRVAFRFDGAELELSLSHALFSSYDVDSGTKMLLSSMARARIAQKAKTALDLGCGVGVIGLALGASNPELRVAFRDRDSLALAFTRANAERNAPLAPGAWADGAPDLAPGLLLRDMKGRRFDLIVSNVPAKAGNPVIADFLARAPRFLEPEGQVWIVIVNTLAALARDAISKAGHAIIRDERGTGHTVFAFGPSSAGGAACPEPDDAILARSRSEFELEGVRYGCTGWYGLPDFDTVGHAHELAAELFDRAGNGRLLREALIANPGVGHSACFAAKRFPDACLDFECRDWLQFLASSRNAEAARAGSAGAWIDPFSASSDGRRYDFVLEFADVVPEVDWAGVSWERAAALVKPGGAYAIVTAPAELERFARRKAPGFAKNIARRHRSAAAILWTRS
jgi:SAM-dependent methyltransferase